jgi:hypothetical protein
MKADLVKMLVESLEAGKDSNGIVWEFFPKLLSVAAAEESLLGFGKGVVSFKIGFNLEQPSSVQGRTLEIQLLRA